MTLTFLNHQIKAFWRSKNTGRSVAIRIVMAVLILYFLVNILVVAFFLDKILQKTYPELNLVDSFTGFIFYYFLLDLLTRFQMQELPTLSVRPYLHLPIKRRQIINYLSITSLGSAFNLSPFLLFVPFMVKIILPDLGAGAFLGMLLAIFGLTMLNHFFCIWIKRKVNINAMWMLGFFALMFLLFSLDFYFEVFSIRQVSSSFFRLVLSQPLYSVVTLVAAIAMYLINHTFLRNNLYLDELNSSDKARKSSTEIPFLNRFGKVGDLTANELKLILRNKRPRSVVTMSAMFMFYGLIFYKGPDVSNYSVIFCGMFMTGIFIINYGQFMFSWQSAHFDGILVNKIDIRDFFKAKHLLFSLLSSVFFILTIPYVFFGWRVLLIHFIMYLWNLGVNTLVVLYFANRNFKRIDLSKGSSFNWEGTGSTQFLIGIPLFITPFIIYMPLAYFGYETAGLITLALIGLIFLLTREFWMNKLIEKFEEKKYQIAEGFRNE